VVELVTARLRLRRWRDGDVDALAAINADPEVMRWIGDGSARDRAATGAEIAASERLWRTRGYGRFAVEIRDTGELAGLAGMAVPDDVPDVMPAVEIGWRLARAHWGRGLATEAARAALRFALADAGLDRLVGVHVVGNDASARIMLKLGMRFQLATTEVVYGRPVHVYATGRPSAPGFLSSGPPG
jgi:RimJ/RimL family protein N-acetyltransferase